SPDLRRGRVEAVVVTALEVEDDGLAVDDLADHGRLVHAVAVAFHVSSTLQRITRCRRSLERASTYCRTALKSIALRSGRDRGAPPAGGRRRRSVAAAAPASRASRPAAGASERRRAWSRGAAAGCAAGSVAAGRDVRRPRVPDRCAAAASG